MDFASFSTEKNVQTFTVCILDTDKETFPENKTHQSILSTRRDFLSVNVCKKC